MPPENLANRQGLSYTYVRQTIHMPGLAQMPGAGPAGTPCVFVRVHNPYELEIVTWSCECEGGLPLVPSPLSAANAAGLNDNRILLSMTISGVIPVPRGGGIGHVFVMSGTYTYGKRQPEGPITDYKLGKLPYETHGVSDNYLPKENFVMGIIDPVPPKPKYPLENPSADTGINQEATRQRGP